MYVVCIPHVTLTPLKLWSNATSWAMIMSAIPHLLSASLLFNAIPEVVLAWIIYNAKSMALLNLSH